MEYGKGLAGVFISFLQLIETFAIGLITGAAVIWFFYLIVKYIWNLRNGKSVDDIKKQIPWALVLLTVMFTIYGLIAIFANIFGVANSGSNNIYFQ